MPSTPKNRPSVPGGSFRAPSSINLQRTRAGGSKQALRTTETSGCDPDFGTRRETVKEECDLPSMRRGKREEAFQLMGDACPSQPSGDEAIRERGVQGTCDVEPFMPEVAEAA